MIDPDCSIALWFPFRFEEWGCILVHKTVMGKIFFWRKKKRYLFHDGASFNVEFLWPITLSAQQLSPTPRLAHLDDDAAKCTALQVENESLRRRLYNALQKHPEGAGAGAASRVNAAFKDLPEPKIPHRPDLMDDFDVIAKCVRNIW